MAKEMMIIFVYDTELVQKEDDDPASAILYFYPSWVSDQQKTALCGQLVGTIHCFKSIFSLPKVVSLQSGKFFIREYGRYLLAVGTDRNINDWLLEHRAKTLSDLIELFYQDIELLASNCENTSKLSNKLYHLFETYLKYLFMGANIFSYIPSIKLPKSASNMFLEALHILQGCQEINYVLGGTLLYHNKVVATQLSSGLTKQLVLTDPYRIKCPAENPILDFDLPLGVQLLQVYISNDEYYKLLENSLKYRNIFQYFNSNKHLKKNHNKSFKEPVISAMKRDQSLIFTAVPEEGTESIIKINQKQNRPKFLNLKSKTSDFTNNNNNNNTSIKQQPSSSFTGQTSVCSTPMGEFNKIIHEKALSICINNIERNIDKNNIEIEFPIKKMNLLNKFVPYLDIIRNFYDKKKYSSAFDLREKLKSINKSITLKYYNLDIDDLKVSTDNNNDMNKKFKTITDPNYPIFKIDGTSISHIYYEDYLKNHLNTITKELEQIPLNDNDNKYFKDFDASILTDEPTKLINNEHRKSLTLPLKPLNLDANNINEQFNLNKKNSIGVQLTPLMSKLSCSSGFCSRETTPLYTPTTHSFPFNLKKFQQKNSNYDKNTMQKCILFIYGQQDVVVNLLLQEDCCKSIDVINKLVVDICNDNLERIEKQLHHCLETYSGSSQQNDSEPYSYLYLDPEWDTIQRSGPWGNTELGALTHLHRDFKEASYLTEILLRCCDGVIYGYQNGKSEIFYHQTATSNPGLPTPADLMGTVPIKAKRRLERDHAIILL